MMQRYLPRTLVTGFLAGALLLGLVLLVPSCGSKGHAPLLVGTNVWLGYEPLFLARQLGHLPQQEVRLLEFTSNTDSLHAFRQGILDAAALTLDEALLLAQQGLDFQVVLVMDISHGADAILAQGDIEDFDDLKGCTIGVENTAVGAYMLSRALEMHDLTSDDVTITPMEIYEHEQGFLEGNVDAVVTFEPVRSRLLQQGARQLFDSSQIPQEIVDVLIVRRDVLDTKRYHVKKLLSAWFQALDYLQANQSEAIKRMTARLDLSSSEIITALAGLRFPSRAQNSVLLDRGTQSLAASGTKLAKVMLRNGLLAEDVAVPPLLNNRLMGEL